MRESQSNALHSRDTSVLVQFGSHSGNHNPKLPFLSPLAFDMNTCLIKGRDVAYRGSLGIMQGQGWTQLCEDVGQKRGTALALQGPPVFGKMMSSRGAGSRLRRELEGSPRVDARSATGVLLPVPTYPALIPSDLCPGCPDAPLRSPQTYVPPASMPCSDPFGPPSWLPTQPQASPLGSLSPLTTRPALTPWDRQLSQGTALCVRGRAGDQRGGGPRWRPLPQSDQPPGPFIRGDVLQRRLAPGVHLAVALAWPGSTGLERGWHIALPGLRGCSGQVRRRAVAAEDAPGNAPSPGESERRSLSLLPSSLSCRSFGPF